MPSTQCEIFIALVNGAPNRVAPDAMAYGSRDAKFVLNVHGRWDHAHEDESCISWARAFFKASAPYASAGAYVNFMTHEEGDRVAAAYGSNYDRLVQIKNKFDPDNLFHLNQNIKP
jgi:FAD/FMN-containing dehydrogenase